MADLPEFPFLVAGRYEVLAELGRGGFAIVYRARDRQLSNREVALKLLREDVISQSATRRFSLEIKSQSRLEHPNILHVYDAGVWDDRMYYVMPCIEGETLETRLKRVGPLPLDVAFEITRSIGAALQYAHEQNVIHRDVKPANVLLGHDGAMLGDFGVARMHDPDLSGPITSTGFAVGTTQYMSPEQLCAEPTIDGRSDQYALALICYEMITGVRPHVAASADGLRALRLAGTIVPVSVHRPAAPPTIASAVLRALSPNPADRFATVSAFVETLALRASSDAERPAVSAGGSRMSAPRASVGGRERRLRPVHAGSGVGVIAALALGGWYFASARRVAGESADARSVVAFVASPSADSAFASRIRGELDQWPDITVRETTASVTSAQLDAPDGRAWRAAARQVKASVLARAVASHDKDSTRYTVVGWNAVSGRTARVTATVGSGAPLDQQTVRGLVARFLIGAAADSSPGLSMLPVADLLAARTYVDAWRLLRAGSLDSARKRFAKAASMAPSFAYAHLWAAQTGAWTAPKLPSTWLDDARRTARLSAGLTREDSALAAALVRFGSGDPTGACDGYRWVLGHDPDSFQAQFGLGQCQHYDSVVIKDARDPAGVRFRSSYWSALVAYQKALTKLPDARMARLFADAIPTASASGFQLRPGVARVGDAVSYYGLPSFAGDTVAIVPLSPQAVFGGAAVPETYSSALARGRAALIAFCEQWTAVAPRSPDAWFALANAQELVGKLDAPGDQPSARASLREAALLQSDDDLRAQISVARVRVTTRLGHFSGADSVARAALQAFPSPTPELAATLAPLAAFLADRNATTRLLKRASQTERASVRMSLPEWAINDLPMLLADSLRDLGVRAILEDCDGLDARRVALEQAFERHLAPADLQRYRGLLLREPFLAALPCLGPSAFAEFGATNPLEQAVAAIAKGDKTGAQRQLDQLSAARRGLSRTSVTADVVLLEVRVLLAMGDSARARSKIVESLDNVASLNQATFQQVRQAAALRALRILAGR